MDHPGIVHSVSTVLSERKISIDQLETEVFTGSMTGEKMFSAKATVVLPDASPVSELRSSLEKLAQDIMVEIEVVDSN